MSRIEELTKEEAIEILLKCGTCNEKEKDWTKRHIEYLYCNGRRLFYKILLTQEEFRLLIPNGCQDDKKAEELKEKIIKNNYNQSSFLFLRDLNSGEKGSYYIENGKHRVSALKKLSRYYPVSAILVCKNHRI